MLLIPAEAEQVDLCEVEARLDYGASSKRTRAIQRNPASNK